MCIATLAERSRTSLRLPGQGRVAGEHPAVGVDDADADVADRLLLGSAAGPGDAGDADAEVGAEALDRAAGHRLGDLGRDRADGPRSALRRRRAGRSSPGSSRRPRRRRSSPRSRGSRSGGPRAALPCTTPRAPIVDPASSAGDDLVDALAAVGVDEVAVTLAQGREEAVSQAPVPVPVADVDLELGAAAQAGRDLERSRGRCRARSRAGSWPASTPGSRTSSSSRPRSSPPGRARSPTGPDATAAGHIACSSRGGPGSTTTTGPSASTTSPGAVPAGSSAIAPSGTIACLRVPSRRPSGSNFIRRANPATISAIRFSIASSRTISRPLKPRDDLGGQVVGGRAEARRW